MSERRLRLALGALGLAGLGVASYLTWAHFSGGGVACTTGGCETVQRSRWSHVAGVPVPLAGVVAYVLLLASVALRGELAAAAGVAVAVASGVFGTYLLVLQPAVVGAICQWCVASDSLTILLAGLAVARLRALPRPVAPPPTRRASAGGSRRGTRTSSRPRPGTRAPRAR